MEFLIGAAWIVLVVIPFFKLLPKYGLNALWSLLAILPVGIIILLWIMASRADERG